MPLPIVTPRLRLREFSAGDLEPLERLLEDARVRALAPAQSHALEAVKRLTARPRPRALRRRRAFELAVELRRGGKLIGACDLALTGPRQGDIGYVIAPRHWGFGYATEVAAGLVDFAFEQLGLKELTAIVTLENERSRRVLAKAGLRWDGLMRRHTRFAGRWWDCHRYIVERAAWEAARVKPCA